MMSLRIIVAAALALVLAQGPAVAQDKVVFALNWVPYGIHFGVFAAKELGYYRDANVDIDIQRGYGSGDTVKRVGTGVAGIGMADEASVIVGRGKGLKVRQIATVLDRSADAIFYVKGLGINQPKDLEGHTLGAAAGETSLNLLPVFGAGAGVDTSKIHIINLTPPAKFPSLVSGKVDSIVAFTTEEPAIQSAAQKAGVQVGRFLFRDYGVDYYSIGIIASDDMLAKKPDLIKRVATATMRGYAWAAKHPEKAADFFVKNFPATTRDLMLAQWKVTIGLMLTDYTRAHGVGAINPDKMAKTLALIRKYQEVSGNVSVDDVYSTKYLGKVAAE